MNSSLYKAAVAEALGTFTLIFIGVLSISAGSVIEATTSPASLATIALAHGLAIAVMVAALGAISGGHFNPAVTLGFLVARRMSLVRGVTYWLAQLIGAVSAAFIIVALFGSAAVGAGTPVLGPNVSVPAAIVLEAIGTFFLVLVIFGTAVDPRASMSVFPFAIGLTISLVIMAIGPLTGASINPARAFGPALASSSWSNHLVYWVGPLIGGAIAAVVEGNFLIEQPSPPEGPAPVGARLRR